MDLKNARIEINKIDKEIVNLLEKRFNIVLEIGRYKNENNIPVYDAEREKFVVKNCIEHLNNIDFSKQIKDIYEQIMNSSKELE